MLARARQRVRRHARWAFVAAALVALTFAAIAATSLLILGWRDVAAISLLVSIVGIGAFVGGSVSALFAEGAAAYSRPSKRFALWLVAVGFGAIVGGAALYAIHYKWVFGVWHFPFPSVGWAFQTFFTMLGAAFFYAVLGLRLLLPWALVPLVVGALAFHRRPS